MQKSALPRYVIAMPTLSRTIEEAQTLRESIEVLMKLGAPLIVADAGSQESLCDFLESSSQITLLRIERGPGSSLVRQIKAALAETMKFSVDRILYTEPDKKWFFANRVAEFLRFGFEQTAADIVLASRDEDSWKTFPPTQQMTERLTNQVLAHFLGQQADYLYGPLLISSRLIPFVQNIPNDLGWGWRIFLMALGHRLNGPLVCFTENLPCPLEQRNEDDERTRIYRLEQMAQNLRGAAAGLKFEIPR